MTFILTTDNTRLHHVNHVMWWW